MNAEIISVIKRIGFLVILGAIYYWYYHEPVRDSSGLIIELGIISPLDLFSGDCYEEDKQTGHCIYSSGLTKKQEEDEDVPKKISSKQF